MIVGGYAYVKRMERKAKRADTICDLVKDFFIASGVFVWLAFGVTLFVTYFV